MIDKKVVERVLSVYKDAWENQDPDKIISIFTIIFLVQICIRDNFI